ncbi:hypothetical protein GCM10027605_20960 [Micromonospora zhanjiangensis]
MAEGADLVGGADMSHPDRAPDDSSIRPEPAGDRPDPAATVAPVGDDLAATVAALSADEIVPAQRRRLLGKLVGELRTRGTGDLFKPRAALRWLTEAVSDIAPYVPIRDHETLRRHHGGLDGDALAERLIRNAARATAGIGAAGGGVAAVEWTVTPTLLTAPVLLAAETVAVVAIELKLLGELHEVYDTPVPGIGGQRAMALIHVWSSQRGSTRCCPGPGWVRCSAPRPAASCGSGCCAGSVAT